ncbi:MAG: flagellar export chaperone FliS [Immundisolibacter sp.]|uniref:flagellar export chaperone FliS n=1 Tax=Immundisolibacter sp. TaxID=1934948 RepID=UPI00356802B1
MTPHSSAALKQYASVQVQSGVTEATPHRLTAMLFDGALARIGRAKGHMQRGELAAKGEAISATIAIVGTLGGSLRREAAPELVDRLAALYDYILRRLIAANADNRVDYLDEAGRLLATLAEAWHAIDPAKAALDQAVNG